MDLTQFSAQFFAQFSDQLAKRLNSYCIPDSLLSKSMEYTLNSPGKRVRPQLVFDSAKLVALPEATALTIANSIEMVHAFSLIHDDLPCMDDDDERRGIPTNHIRFGEAQALLAGDGLLCAALLELSQLAQHIDSNYFQSTLRFFLECVGPRGMIGGQSLELETTNPNPESLVQIQDLKTTALFRASVLCPFLAVGKPEESKSFQECRQFANDFGFAFQIADDLEDATQDQISEKKNILNLYRLEDAKKLALARLHQTQVSSHFIVTQALASKLQSMK